MRRPALEEIGARTALFRLDGIKGQERAYIEWLLTQCSKSDSIKILTEEGLATALSAPLQIERYPGLALEATGMPV